MKSPSTSLAAIVVLTVMALSLIPKGPTAPVPTVPDDQPKIDPLSHKPYTEMIPGSKLRFVMVAIPGGTYHIGSPDREPGRDKNEGPRRRVQIAPFWMGKMEVTWEEYDAYRGKGVLSEKDNDAARVANADAITRPTPPYPDETRGFGKEGRPVLGISHHAAMEYCRWLSKKTGRVYRLPTEAEWEWACRAGTRTPWFFGNKADDLGAYAWFRTNAKDEPHPVGRKKPNPWGLHDIYGNVAEWCLDHYEKDRYAKLTADRLHLCPVLVPTEKRYAHVVRGGSYDDPAGRCRSAYRTGSDKSWNRIDPDEPKTIWWEWSEDTVGFRVVRAVKEQDELRGIKSRVRKNKQE